MSAMLAASPSEVLMMVADKASGRRRSVTRRRLVLIIGLFDLLTMGKVALSDPPWQAFSTEVYVTLAAIYIAFCLAMSRYSRGLERELGASQRR